MRLIILVLIIFLTGCNPQKDTPEHNIKEWIPDTEHKINALVRAIYHAEGGDKATYKWGIRSIPCEGKECEKYAKNTVVNQVRRFRNCEPRCFDSYLESLSARYAPIGADNDPKGLNVNWLRNVTYFLERELRKGGG